MLLACIVASGEFLLGFSRFLILASTSKKVRALLSAATKLLNLGKSRDPELAPAGLLALSEAIRPQSNFSFVS